MKRLFEAVLRRRVFGSDQAAAEWRKRVGSKMLPLGVVAERPNPPMQEWSHKVATAAYPCVVGLRLAEPGSPVGGPKNGPVFGSGLLVHPSGLVMTTACRSGAAEGKEVDVTLRNRQVLRARVAARCNEVGVALLKLDASPGMSFPYVPVGAPDCRPLELQQLIVMSGDDGDSLVNTIREAASGSKAALAVRLMGAEVERWVGAGVRLASPVADAAEILFTTRNSKGPLHRQAGSFAFNHHGEAVGMVAIGRSGLPDVAPVPVLVPVDELLSALGRALRPNEARRPVEDMLGGRARHLHQLDDATLAELAAAGIDVAAGGMYLDQVEPGGLLDMLALENGDLVVELDGRPIPRPLPHLVVVDARSQGAAMPVQFRQWLALSVGSHHLTARRRLAQEGQPAQYGPPESVPLSFNHEVAYDPLSSHWALESRASEGGPKR